MQDQLYIPKKIKVGYQHRSDTYTKKLAYVIYFDDKGVLRKQKSWDGWRDSTIDPEEFDNTPQSGFILNKDIKRWGHFNNSGRTMIRIYDPRGIEFEITSGNLIGILMNTNCSKRALESEFVYAWYGPELVLLPVTCEEYAKATAYTELQGGKIGVKDLIPGCSYKTKKEGDMIYVGKYMWYPHEAKVVSMSSGKPEFHTANSTYSRYGYSNDQNCYIHGGDGDKKHIFTSDDGKNFIVLKSLSSLAVRNNDTPVSNFAAIVDKLKKNIHIAKIIGGEITRLSTNDVLARLDRIKDRYGSVCMLMKSSRKPQLNVFVLDALSPIPFKEFYEGVLFTKRDEWVAGKNGGYGQYELQGEPFKLHTTHDVFIGLDNEVMYKHYHEQRRDHFRFGYNNRNYDEKVDLLTNKQLETKEFFSLKVVFENGVKREVGRYFGLGDL
jgi:hypothetical protein